MLADLVNLLNHLFCAFDSVALAGRNLVRRIGSLSLTSQDYSILSCATVLLGDHGGGGAKGAL